MVATKDWKMVHFHGNLPPMLFDLNSDPNELNDLGRVPDYQSVRDQMYKHLQDWGLRMAQRTALSEQDINRMSGQPGRKGVLRGLYDGSEVDPKWIKPIQGKAKIFRPS